MKVTSRSGDTTVIIGFLLRLTTGNLLYFLTPGVTQLRLKWSTLRPESLSPAEDAAHTKVYLLIALKFIVYWMRCNYFRR